MKKDYLFVFSENVRLFLNRVRLEILKILSREVGLTTEKGWFLFQGTYHHVGVILFEHPRMLGFYNPSKTEIGLHKRFMLDEREDLVADILRHEIGHLMTHLQYGEAFMDHGPCYRAVCSIYNWEEKVQSATVDIEDKGNPEGEGSNHETVIRRVKKLLALASSDNPHEAELAALKANQMLLLHNISLLNAAGLDDGDRIYMKRVIEAGRSSAKLMAIGRILESFLVSPVFNHGEGLVYLEVTGERANVEIAEHVASFLDRTLESMWTQARMKGMAGLRDKNSFMTGVAEGYLAKMKKTRSEYSPGESLALMVLESRLNERLKLVYPRIRSTRSQSFLNSRSFGEGKEAGERLSIRTAIQGVTNSRFLLK